VNDHIRLEETSAQKRWWIIQFRRKRSLGDTSAFAATKEEAVAQFLNFYPDCGILSIKPMPNLAPRWNAEEDNRKENSCGDTGMTTSTSVPRSGAAEMAELIYLFYRDAEFTIKGATLPTWERLSVNQQRIWRLTAAKLAEHATSELAFDVNPSSP
jgi:hypothetical protein